MAKYQKRPIVVEAVQWTGSNLSEILVFCPTAQHDIIDTAWEVGKGRPHILLKIPTNEGVMIASDGDYIIRGPKGDFYPCKPDIFAMTYDQVDDSTKIAEPETMQEDMMAFMKKHPIYDEVIQYNGHNAKELHRVCPDMPGLPGWMVEAGCDEDNYPVMVPATIGHHTVYRSVWDGDWLVRDGDAYHLFTDEVFGRLLSRIMQIQREEQ